MRWIRDYQPQPEQGRLYRQALILTLGGNLLLAVGKGVAAYVSGSVALYADAANSVSDVFYSLMMVLGLWVAQRPPDISHPQGHSRFEPLVGISVAFSMGLAGYEAARTALIRFQMGGLAVEAGLPAVVLLISALIKVFMFLRIRTLARSLHSPTLATTAKDNLSDVLTSTAAFVGAFGSSLIHPLADPIAGFLVAAWIFRAAFLAVRENLGFLTGAGASEEVRQQIAAAAQEIPGVQAVHHLMAEYVGPQLVVDLHINVDTNLPLKDTHAIEDAVVARLEAIPEVDRAYVHIEPVGWH